MLKKIAGLLRHIHIRVFLLILGLIFPFNWFMAIQQKELIDGLVEQASLVMQNLIDSYVDEISVRMENARDLLNRYVLNDEYCIRMNHADKMDEKYQVNKLYFYYSLSQIGTMVYGADGYYFYFENTDDMITYCNNSSEEDMRRHIGYNLGKNVREEIRKGWSIYEYNEEKYLMFQADYSNLIFGSWINLDEVERKISGNIEYEEYNLFFSEENEENFSHDTIHLSADNGKIYLNFTVGYGEVLGIVASHQKVQYIIMILMFLLSPVLYLGLRQMLLKPLSVLQMAHQKLQTDFDFRITEQGKSIEYETLYKSFNNLADNLNDLKIEGYEKELEKRKMEIINLRLQTHPHFLLNTFNLMFKLAQRGEIKAVQDVILYLSDYFRYIFRNNRELDLFFKERRLIDAYLKIVSLRFQQKVEIQYYLDPEIDLVRIPSLLIHNFVENCVKHGFSANRILHITINGTYENKRVVFEIIDDGNGMDEKTLNWQRKIINGEVEPDNPNEHVGLVNSIKRLRYYYGDSAEIKIDTVPDEMMCFTVSFPYNLEMENEFTDCK